MAKLDGKLCRQLPEFSAQDDLERASFLITAFKSAQILGLVSELGCGAYILAAWWLGIGFETKSDNL